MPTSQSRCERSKERYGSFTLDAPRRVFLVSFVRIIVTGVIVTVVLVVFSKRASRIVWVS